MRLDRYPILAAAAALLALTLAGPPPVSAGSVTLMWTAPGNDSLVGLASRYDIRYAIWPITPANFPIATPIPGLPAPASPGVIQTFTVTLLEPGVLYYFALKTADASGNWSALSNVVSSVAEDVGLEPLTGPIAFSPPSPNPASGQARFDYVIPQPGRIRVDAFDIQGRHVRTIADGWYPAGQSSLSWDLHDDAGRRVGEGVLLVRATLSGQTFLRRLAIIR